MKKVLLICMMFSFISTGASAQTIDPPNGFLSPPNIYAWDKVQNRPTRRDRFLDDYSVRPFDIYKTDKGMFFGWTMGVDITRLIEPDLKLFRDGYFHYIYPVTNVEFVFIYGGDLMLWSSADANVGWASKDIQNTDLAISDPVGMAMKNEFTYLYDGIKAIAASSSLIEKERGQTVTYGPERMQRPFFAYWEGGLGYNWMKRCWAEGAKGPGIGERINVTLDEPSSSVMIINGYVDMGKRYLYKANNRVKEFLVTSENPKFSFVEKIDDYVHLHEIKFPSPTSQFELKIVSVYPGEKYDDTCVSAIYLKQPQFYGTDSYKKAVKGIEKYFHDKHIAGF